MTDRTVALPPPCGWARIGLRNGRAYIADTYTLNPYPPPADVAERLNVVPVHDEPTVRRLLAEARAQEREACAKLCDPEPVDPWDPYTARNNKATMRLLAQRIRARGDSNGK